MAEKIVLRGQDTRQRLLDVATTLFSERGFDGVSTRDIASAAGTTLPSIPHYFDSKVGLYKAVLQSIAGEMSDKMLPASTAALGVLNQQQASRDEKVEALINLLNTHAWGILYSRPEWARLMVQEQVYPSPASTPVNEALEQHLIHPLIGLIASLHGLPPDSSEVKLQAFFLVGRVLIFRTVRSSALSLMDWPEFTPDRIKMIIDLLETEVRLLFSVR